MDNLKSIYEAITPENLKNIPVYDDSMNILIELLEEKSKVSIQTENFFNHNITKATEEELIKIYLYDYYSMIQKILSNYHIISRFKKENEILRPQFYGADEDKVKIGDKAVINFFEFGGSIISENYNSAEFDNTLEREIQINPIYKQVFKLKDDLLRVSAENFYFNRIFKETKGFYSSMNYIYDIINKYLTPEDEQIPFDIKEIYRNNYMIGDRGLFFDRPAPNGQTLRFLDQTYVDPFKFKINGSINKTVYKNTVQYLAHPLGFIYDYTQTKQIQLEDHFSVKISYINSIVEVRCILGNSERYNKPLLNVIKSDGLLKVIFDDYSYLTQEQNIIKYLDKDGRTLKVYNQSDQCIIYYSYNLLYSSGISDNISFIERKTFDVDKFEVDDFLSSILKYTPRVGLLIGFFYFNNTDRFDSDGNRYLNVLEDDSIVHTFNRSSFEDKIKMLDDNSFNLKEIIGVEKIEVLDEIKSYKITLNNYEEVIISEDKKIKIITNNQDVVTVENNKDYFSFNVPLNMLDLEIIDDSADISSSNKAIEQMEYSDKLHEILKIKFLDEYIVNDDILQISNINLLDNNNFYENLEILSKNTNKDIINYSDTLNETINKKMEENFYIDDNIMCYSLKTHKEQDVISIDDSLSFTLISSFKQLKPIGEYIIGESDAKIGDSDYYKYYDNMDII